MAAPRQQLAESPRALLPAGLAAHDRPHPQVHRPAPGARKHKLAADPGLAIWHFPGGNLSDLVRKVDRYTDIEARQAYARGKRTHGPGDLLIEAGLYFWRQYIRDGATATARWASPWLSPARTTACLTAAKLWELPRQKARAARYGA